MLLTEIPVSKMVDQTQGDIATRTERITSKKDTDMVGKKYWPRVKRTAIRTAVIGNRRVVSFGYRRREEDREYRKLDRKANST